MSAIETHAPGTFCWVELLANDEQAAKEFYTRFFGWQANDTRYGEGESDIYTMLTLDGRNVGALYRMGQEQRDQGTPTHWGLYVAVDDADQAAARVRELGGTVILEPFEVMDAGRMAMLQDPTGAFLSVWQARAHIGMQVRDEDNAVVWSELATPDPDTAEAFYTGLFGWGTKKEDVGIQYTSFLQGDTPVAGMYRITEEMQGMPPNWSPYFGTSDVDDAARRATELGATLLVEPTDIPGVGRFAVIQDPQGAMFSVVRLDAMQQS
ncbi:MAG TPA: VOC family protein [Longimicrobiaceae bacterium]|nr:VOC family protein [Longimicrobiaceae bacterium]